MHTDLTDAVMDAILLYTINNLAAAQCYAYDTDEEQMLEGCPIPVPESVRCRIQPAVGGGAAMKGAPVELNSVNCGQAAARLRRILLYFKGVAAEHTLKIKIGEICCKCPQRVHGRSRPK